MRTQFETMLRFAKVLPSAPANLRCWPPSASLKTTKTNKCSKLSASWQLAMTVELEAQTSLPRFVNINVAPSRRRRRNFPRLEQVRRLCCCLQWTKFKFTLIECL